MAFPQVNAMSIFVLMKQVNISIPLANAMCRLADSRL